MEPALPVSDRRSASASVPRRIDPLRRSPGAIRSDTPERAHGSAAAFGRTIDARLASHHDPRTTGRQSAREVEGRSVSGATMRGTTLDRKRGGRNWRRSGPRAAALVPPSARRASSASAGAQRARAARGTWRHHVPRRWRAPSSLGGAARACPSPRRTPGLSPCVADASCPPSRYDRAFGGGAHEAGEPPSSGSTQPSEGDWRESFAGPSPTFLPRGIGGT